MKADLELMESDHAALFLVTFRVDISLAKMSKEFIIYHDLSHTFQRLKDSLGKSEIEELLTLSYPFL